MRAVSLIMAVALATAPAHAFIAWSGNNCDGNIGKMVPCDSSCHSFSGRHSFWAQASNDFTACVAIYEDAGCPDSSRRWNYANQSYLQCTHVNTGYNAQSFRCTQNGRPSAKGCYGVP